MNRFTTATVAFSILTLSSISAFAIDPIANNTATGDATAEVVQPISIEPTGLPNEELSFGSFLHDNPAFQAIVTINAINGSVSGLNRTFLDAPTRGYFNVSGGGDRVFKVLLSHLTLTHTNGSDQMTTTIEAYAKGGDDAGTTNRNTPNTLNGLGIADVEIGGILTIQPNQLSGLYSGMYNVTVSYN